MAVIYFLRYLLYQVYYRFKIYSNLLIGRHLILVHQMGKVGSLSLVHTLIEAAPNHLVLHLHSLNSEALKKVKKAQIRNIKSGKKDLDIAHIQGIIVSQLLKSNFGKTRIKIISIVRDPLARNLSKLFYNGERRFKDFENRCKSGQITSAEILEVFLSRKDLHTGPDRWFDREFNAIFGFNIFEEVFNPNEQYAIFKKNGFDILIIRLEDFKTSEKALEKFLSIQVEKIKRTNEAKVFYKDVYEKFKQEKHFNREFLKNYYDTPYSNFFYDESEIDRFKKKWGNPVIENKH